ncbi:hypothetical protein FRC01_013660, partial [Tulasnella sp. 417]
MIPSRSARASSSPIASSERSRFAASSNSATQWSRLPSKVENSAETSSSFEVRTTSRLLKAVPPAQEPRASASLSTRVLPTPKPFGGRRGILQVYIIGGRIQDFYVSKALHDGCFVVAAGKSTALRVWYYQGSGDMLLDNPINGFSSLGVTWSGKNPETGKSSSDSAQIAAVGEPLNNNADVPTSSSLDGVTWPSWQVSRRGLTVPIHENVLWDLDGVVEIAIHVGDGSMRAYA